MGSATMTASFMPCLKRLHFERLICALSVGLLVWVNASVNAQTLVEATPFDIERSSEELSLTTQLQFELSPAVEDALLRGVPIYFKAEANVFKERWYWYDKSVVSASRHYKLAFQPLTRRWRINAGGGGASNAGQGLGLSQSFDNLSGALEFIKRIAKWRIAGPGELETSVRYRLDFRFQLDLSQLPRPFQIGILGQPDWDISLSRSTMLLPEPVK